MDNDKREIGQQLDPKDFIRLMRQDFIADIHNFDLAFADVRETMMRGEWHPGCYKCKADEESKGHSSVQKQMNSLQTLLIVLD